MCYTQHSLPPYIDSEIYYIRHFIEVHFFNNGVEHISLPSIFKDESAVSSIFTYLENLVSSIVCTINLFVELY